VTNAATCPVHPETLSPQDVQRNARIIKPVGWRATFDSLSNRNLRLLVTGLLITSTGTWVQRIAQDWLVLSLSGSAAAVGVSTMCQLLPMLFFGLHAGVIADRFPRRTVLLVTQTVMCVMSCVLAVLVLAHGIEVWQVDVLAFALGTASALDTTARQAFVPELVEPRQLRNAVSLVSSVFQLGAMLGPALAGVLLGTIGPGYCFALNVVSTLGAIVAIAQIRQRNPHTSTARAAGGDGISQTLVYVRRRGTLVWPIVLISAYSLFTFSLPVTLAAYAHSVFDTGPGGYATLNSVVALGSIAGALCSARRTKRMRLRVLVAVGGGLAAMEISAALAPAEWVFLPLIAMLGATTMYFVASVQTMVQVGTEVHRRGRVLGVYLLAFFGSGALGGPLVGYLDSRFGPQTGLLIAGVVSALSTLGVGGSIAYGARMRVTLRPLGPRSLIATW